MFIKLLLNNLNQIIIENQVLQILKKCLLNITLLQKTKNIKSYKSSYFLSFKQAFQYNAHIRIIFRKSNMRLVKTNF